MTDADGTASLEANLRLGNGLTEHDRQRVLRRLSRLDRAAALIPGRCRGPPCDGQGA